MFIMCDKSFFFLVTYASHLVCCMHVCVYIFVFCSRFHTFGCTLEVFKKKKKRTESAREQSIGKKIGILLLLLIILLLRLRTRKLNGNNIFARAVCWVHSHRSYNFSSPSPILSTKFLVHQSSWRRLFNVRARQHVRIICVLPSIWFLLSFSLTATFAMPSRLPLKPLFLAPSFTLSVSVFALCMCKRTYRVFPKPISSRSFIHWKL